MQAFDKKTIKLAILKAVKNSSNGKNHKFNILGRPSQSGALERELKGKLSDEDRAKALRYFGELVEADRLRPTMDDLKDPENWVTITNKGDDALSSQRFEEDESHIDKMTGLPLLEKFKEDVQFELNQKSKFSIAFIDMDNLKSLNEKLGHPGADHVIKEFAHALKEYFTKGTVYRRTSSGDEFLCLLRDMSEAESFKLLHEALEKIRARTFSALNSTGITFSAGLATSDSAQDLIQLEQAADKMMYEAKNSGKNTIVSSLNICDVIQKRDREKKQSLEPNIPADQKIKSTLRQVLLVVSVSLFLALVLFLLLYRFNFINFNKASNADFPPLPSNDDFEREVRSLSGDRLEKVRMHYRRAFEHYSRKKFREAVSELEKSIEVVPTASAYLHLGNSLLSLSETGQGLLALNRGLQIAVQSRNDKLVAYFETNIGAALIKLGKFDESTKPLLDALAYFQKTGDKLDQSQVLGNLGTVYLSQGIHLKAIKYFEESEKIFSETGNLEALCHVYNNLGMTHAELGDVKKARKYYLEALNPCTVSGDSETLAGVNNNIGNLEFDVGQLRSAESYYKRAEELARTSGNLDTQALVLASLGRLSMAAGNYDDAILKSENALQIFRKTGNRWYEAKILRGISQIHFRRRDAKKMLENLEAAYTISEEIGDYYGEGEALFNSGVLLQHSDNLSFAEEHFQKALSAFELSESEKDIAKSLFHLGSVEIKLNKSTNGSAHLKEAINKCLSQQLRCEWLDEAKEMLNKTSN